LVIGPLAPCGPPPRTQPAAAQARSYFLAPLDSGKLIAIHHCVEEMRSHKVVMIVAQLVYRRAQRTITLAQSSGLAHRTPTDLYHRHATAGGSETNSRGSATRQTSRCT